MAKSLSGDSARIHEATNFVLERTADGVDLVVTGEWSRHAREALENGHADGLVLNYARGFPEQPIDFIAGLPIRKLDLLARSVSDLSPLYSLSPWLQELRVQSDPRAVIELERLPQLRTLAASWLQLRASIVFAPQLEHLSVASYSDADLSPLEALASLSSLVMKQRPKLQSLDGIETFPWLSHLGIHGGAKLQDISALDRYRPLALQVLRFEACRKIDDIASVANCPSLQFFELSEGAAIPTAAPLVELVNLERLYLYGSTKIFDNDLTPVAGLPKLHDLRIQNRRGYSPPVDEIKDAIARRSGPADGSA